MYSSRIYIEKLSEEETYRFIVYEFEWQSQIVYKRNKHIQTYPGK